MYPPYNYGPPPYNVYPPYENYRRKSQNSRRKPSDDIYSDDDLNSVYTSKKHSTRQKTLSNAPTKRSFTKPVILNKNRLSSLLKKHFFAVTFVFFLKKDSKKLALTRKNNNRKFWLEKFDSQMTNMKNWLL